MPVPQDLPHGGEEVHDRVNFFEAGARRKPAAEITYEHERAVMTQCTWDSGENENLAVSARRINAGAQGSWTVSRRNLRGL